jgi:ribosomal protein S12 methylthiotransferase
MEAQAEISGEINASLVGTEQEVLIEGTGEARDYPFAGRCRRQAPDIDGVTLVKGTRLRAGQFRVCRVTDAETYDLYASALGKGDRL